MSNTQTKEPKNTKVRVFALAKELKLETKELLEFCKELGFAGITNQLHGLEPDQAEALKERVKKGHKSPGAPAPSPNVPPRPVTLPTAAKLENKIQNIPKPKSPPPPHRPNAVEPAPAPVSEHPAEEAATEPQSAVPTETAPIVESMPVLEAPSAPEFEAPVAEKPAEPVRPQNIIPTKVQMGDNRPLNLRRPSNPPKSATPAARPPEAPAATPPAAPEKPVMAAQASPTPVEPPEAPTPQVQAATPEAKPAPEPKPATEPKPEPRQAIPPKPQVPPGGGPVFGRAGTVPTTPLSSRSGSPAQLGSAPRSGAPQPPRPTNPNANRPGTPPQQGTPGSRPAQPQSPHGGPQRQPGQSHGQEGRSQGPGQHSHGPQGPGQHSHGPQGQNRPGGSQRPGPHGGGQQQPHGGPPKPTIGGMGPPRVPPPKTSPGQVKLTPEMVDKLRKASQQGKKFDIKEIQKTGEINTPSDRPPTKPGEAKNLNRPPQAPGKPDEGGEDGSDDRKGGAKKSGTGAVIGRDERHKARQQKGGNRRSGASTDRASVIIGAGGRVDTIEERFGSRIKKFRGRQQQKVEKKIEGPVSIAPPVTVRSLSEAIGMKAGELILRLKKETNKLYAINSNVEFEVAELIAIEKGIQLVLKQQLTAEDKLLEQYKKRASEVDAELLLPRAPIVTIMGHVDHGKTSLLDKIRQEFGMASDVVSTEAGGITQVIRAWQVQKDDKRITFLDTPGHEAFTKMRARGAKVTDIAVIVVAATDGVMPQTEEAINHAKAAGVDIIVAINKIDMPNANVDKTRRQLYALELLPDDMGGDVPFVETSAVTGDGISELLESILLVAELADLKADPTHPASGTCLEAYLEGQEGVMATLIVQQGTLRKGDVVLCGATFGRVRAMYNDLGLPIDEAGPCTPVKISGLDQVPDADDPFYAVDDVSTAREIAEKRKDSLRGASLSSFAPVSLESLTAAKTRAKITELKVILKAEARGSVEAIKKELEKLVHEEVKVRVLHAGIGAITESDVILSLTSPEDTLVIGFNVTADDPALKLAEQRGIKIREYDIIYKLTDDVKAALEGKLKPIEEVVHLGRAVVRETFKISKVGTIAGCYVTSGTIERNARVRVIRSGIVIYPSSEKVTGLDSLKRFKDDAKEVREGFECGLKISGFDDIKVDDVIEAFKIEVKYRTL